MSEKNDYKTMTDDELLEILWQIAADLGYIPRKRDIEDPQLKGQLRLRFGRWIYALEAAGFRIPSSEIWERRKHTNKKWKRVASRIEYYQTPEGRAAVQARMDELGIRRTPIERT